MIFHSADGARDDAIRLLTYIGDYYLDHGVEHIDVDTARVLHLVREMHEEFPHPGGEDDASPFKKVAVFVCHFTARNPVSTALPDEFVGNRPQGQTAVARSNAMVALEVALVSLRFATVGWKGGEKHLLNEPMELSPHSFNDIADALTNRRPDAFKLVAVLFEQLAYKTNPHAQYQTEAYP